VIGYAVGQRNRGKKQHAVASALGHTSAAVTHAHYVKLGETLHAALNA
jgi:hypothetical protein